MSCVHAVLNRIVLCVSDQRPVQTKLPESLLAARDLRAEPRGWLLRVPGQRVRRHTAAVRAIQAVRRRPTVLPWLGRGSKRTQMHGQE